MSVSELDLSGMYARLVLLEAEVRRLREIIQTRMTGKVAPTGTILAKITNEGQLTLPPEVGRRLRADSETVAVQEVASGIVLLVNPEFTQVKLGEELLRSLVISLGRQAEALGIHEEEALDPVIETIRQESFEARHGGR